MPPLFLTDAFLARVVETEKVEGVLAVDVEREGSAPSRSEPMLRRSQELTLLST